MLSKYSKSYGFIQGVQLLFKLNSKNTDSIRLKNIKHPFRLRSGTSDIPTFNQIFTYQEYAIDLNFIPKVIIDAGANIGLAAVYYANKYPEAKIISIEPEHSNYQLLKENTEPYENIIALNYALSNEADQELSIVDNGYGNWGFMTETISENSESISPTVKTITIEAIMKTYGIETIDILKIDIEGFEKELFEINSEKWLPHVHCLIIELHDRMKDGCSKSVFSAISNYDFSFSHKGENLVFLNTKMEADASR